MRRRGMLGRVLVGPCCVGGLVQAAVASEWREWNDFVARFVQADGRVIDLTFERKSTSEGQSYALFFALVANQRARFDTLLEWTSNNLAGGQLGARLPAWHWGLRGDGSWGVKDPNSASDADLWLAYTLLEAARLWQAPAYAERARRLLEQIVAQEVVTGGASGTLLLPGAFGFKLAQGRFRLNPSYLPGFMLRYLARADRAGPWQAIWDTWQRQAPRVLATGIAPDLFVVDSAGTVLPDTEAVPSASYDAIRVYLWAGMSAAQDPTLARLLAPYARLTRQLGRPPEKVDPLSGRAARSDFSPIGFSGAVLPLLVALDERAALQQQLERIDAAAARRSEPTNYYDQVLLLFGKGWLDGVFRFDDGGRVLPRWAG